MQIRRAGAGTVLIDPVNHGEDPVTTLAPVAEVLATDEWVLHAADQDLPCLAEIGIRPPKLYDTELAGRLAAFDRVNLAAMVQRLLGLQLMKGHGAADWSRRPLPPEWLNYAALDVEVLLELRAAIAAVLEEQGKTEWAAGVRIPSHVRRPTDPPRPVATYLRHTQGTQPEDAGRGAGTVADARPHRPPPRHRPRADLARLRDHQRRNRGPRHLAEAHRVPVFGGNRQRRSAQVWLDALAARAHR